MSAETAFASPVVRKVNGRDITFRRITMAQYGQLEAVVKQRRRDVERALLNELQIVGKDRLEALRKVESDPVLIGDVVCYLNSLEGTRKALAMASDEASAGEAINALGFIDANNLVGELAGLGDAPADPPAAGGTGATTPPSSASAAPAPTPAA